MAREKPKMGYRSPFFFSSTHVVSVLYTVLFFYQPFVDRRELYMWVCDNFFSGSFDTMGQWSLTVLQRMCEWLVVIVFGVLYKLQIPFIENFKTNPNCPWPWNSEDPKVQADHWERTKQSLRWLAAVQTVSFLVSSVADASSMNHHPDNIPEWYISMFQCVVGTFMYDFCFYWAHRLMHTKYLYRFHKQHHSYKNNDVLAAFYAHPLDVALTVIFPLAIPALLFQMHLYTLWQFVVPLTLEAVSSHCGYSFAPWNPLIMQPWVGGQDDMHDLHHRINNCNYGGSYPFWDCLMGTYSEVDHELITKLAGESTKKLAKTE